MKTLHVVIDSCIYRRDPKRNTTGFRAIARLAAARRIQIHVPYYIQQETITGQAKALSDKFSAVVSQLSSVKRVTGHTATINATRQILTQAKQLHKFATRTVEEEFAAWIAHTHALTYKVDDNHGKRVTDAYFTGGAPFKSLKNRNDIPDSFIYESIQDIANLHGMLHVIVADKNLRAHCKRLGNVSGYASVDQFVQTKDCQASLRELDEVSNIDRIRKILPNEQEILETHLEGQLDKPLSEMKATGSIPDDNEEAWIYGGVSLQEYTWFDFEQLEYYGDGVVSIPFEATVMGTIFYHIFKADWHMMSDDERNGINVSDCNRHYYEAEEVRDIDVEGKLVLSFPIEELRKDDMDTEHLSSLIHTIDYSVEVDDARIVDKNDQK